MYRRYAAFLLRCWELSAGAQRIEVVHIQSGDRATVDSLEAAVGWIDRRETADPPPDRQPASQEG